MVSAARAVQSIKAPLPTVFTVPGMVSRVRLRQEAKALSPISVTEAGISMASSFTQPQKPLLPILVRLWGRVTSVSLKATREKASGPISVTPSGMVMTVSFPLYWVRTPFSITKSLPTAKAGAARLRQRVRERMRERVRFMGRTSFGGKILLPCFVGCGLPGGGLFSASRRGPKPLFLFREKKTAVLDSEKEKVDRWKSWGDAVQQDRLPMLRCCSSGERLWVSFCFRRLAFERPVVPLAPLPLSRWNTAPCLLVSTPPWWVDAGREVGG